MSGNRYSLYVQLQTQMRSLPLWYGYDILFSSVDGDMPELQQEDQDENDDNRDNEVHTDNEMDVQSSGMLIYLLIFIFCYDHIFIECIFLNWLIGSSSERPIFEIVILIPLSILKWLLP